MILRESCPASLSFPIAFMMADAINAPLGRVFVKEKVSNPCVFDENVQRISVNGRPKRIEMYAFSNENALVWTKLNTR